MAGKKWLEFARNPFIIPQLPWVETDGKPMYANVKSASRAIANEMKKENTRLIACGPVRPNKTGRSAELYGLWNPGKQNCQHEYHVTEEIIPAWNLGFRFHRGKFTADKLDANVRPDALTDGVAVEVDLGNEGLEVIEAKADKYATLDNLHVLWYAPTEARQSGIMDRADGWFSILGSGMLINHSGEQVPVVDFYKRLLYPEPTDGSVTTPEPFVEEGDEPMPVKQRNGQQRIDPQLFAGQQPTQGELMPKQELSLAKQEAHMQIAQARAEAEQMLALGFSKFLQEQAHSQTEVAQVAAPIIKECGGYYADELIIERWD